MDIVFHFQEASIETEFESYYDFRTEVIETVLGIVPQHRRHIRLRIGSISFGSTGIPEEQRSAVASHLVAGAGIWTTIRRPRRLAEALVRHDAFAIVFEGLSATDAKQVDQAFDRLDCYLGATQIDHQSELHYIFYTMQLPLRYRISSRDLYVLHGADMDPEIAGEDNRDHIEREELEQALVGQALDHVEFQNIGLQETIFDPYTNFDYSKVAGQTSGLLDAYYDAVISELLIRFREADPRLIEALDAAIGTLDSHNLAEQLAQASLSCRRFMERLADALYPPREGQVGGRSVGPGQYKNRLWAYVAEHVGADPRVSVVLTTLADVGARIDKLLEAANTGVHAETTAREVHRLILGLVMLSYDLLTLTPPTGTAARSYDQALADEMRQFIEAGLRDA